MFTIKPKSKTKTFTLVSQQNYETKTSGTLKINMLRDVKFCGLTLLHENSKSSHEDLISLAHIGIVKLHGYFCVGFFITGYF